MAKFNGRITNSELYLKKCVEIELLEGRVNHYIVDFSKCLLLFMTLIKDTCQN